MKGSLPVILVFILHGFAQDDSPATSVLKDEILMDFQVLNVSGNPTSELHDGKITLQFTLFNTTDKEITLLSPSYYLVKFQVLRDDTLVASPRGGATIIPAMPFLTRLKPGDTETIKVNWFIPENNSELQTGLYKAKAIIQYCLTDRNNVIGGVGILECIGDWKTFEFEKEFLIEN